MIAPGSLAATLWMHGRSVDCPVIDMHGHMGRWTGIWFPRASPEAMVATLDRCGVRMLVFCHHDALFCPDIGQSTAIEAVRRFPDRLRAYVGLNPHYPDLMRRDLDAFDSMRDVFVGLKVHADYHQVPWDAPVFERAWRFADERKLPVLGHTWSGSPYNGVGQIRTIAERYPNVRLLLGHSLHADWEQACTVAKDFPNVFLELTAVLDDRGPLELFVSQGLSERLLFGTDLPWFNPHHGIGAVLSAEISDADRHNMLHRNAERLLREAGVVL
jgi:predicted TIM-barrel fold metal-dependent hydrolase